MLLWITIIELHNILILSNQRNGFETARRNMYMVREVGITDTETVRKKKQLYLNSENLQTTSWEII